MLEEYFVKPDTVDRIRACWIGPQIERYVAWLAGEGYRPRTVWHRVPMLLGFAEFAWARGARTVEDLPAHVEAFVADCVARREGCRRGWSGRSHPRSSAGRWSRCSRWLSPDSGQAAAVIMRCRSAARFLGFPST